MPKVVDHDARRDFLARVSAELIADEGLERATIREIAARTGFSRGVIEHYFDDKDHLITMAVIWANDRYIEREARATRGRTGLAALAARLTCVLPVTRESVREWKIRLRFWSLAAYEEALQQMLGTRLHLTRERFLADLQVAGELGEITTAIDAEATANLLVHLVSGASSHALVAPEYYNKKYLKRLVADVIASLGQGDGAIKLGARA